MNFDYLGICVCVEHRARVAQASTLNGALAHGTLRHFLLDWEYCTS